MDERGYVLQYRPLSKTHMWLYVPGLHWATSQDAAYTIHEIMSSWTYNERLPFTYSGDRIEPFLINLLHHWHYNPDAYRIVSLEALLRAQSNLRVY